MMHRLKESISRQSPEEIRQAAHALKGAVGTFSVVGAMETAARIEELARSGKIDEAAALLEIIEPQIASSWPRCVPSRVRHRHARPDC